MNVMVTMRNERHELCLGDDATGADLLGQLDLTPEEAIVVVNGSPFPYTERLPAGESVKVIRVASGG